MWEFGEWRGEVAEADWGDGFGSDGGSMVVQSRRTQVVCA